MNVRPRSLGDMNINLYIIIEYSYEGHGATVHYSSSNASTAGALNSVKFAINSCMFYPTESTQSIVYFG